MTKAKPRLFGTLQDQARLLEGRHDVKAAAAPEQVAPTKAGQALLTESVAELAESRQTLRQAILIQAREAGETDQARAEVNTAITDAVATYAYVRNRIKDALLNLLPHEQRALSTEELALRRRAFNRVLGRNPSDITNQSPEKQVTLLTDVAEAIGQDPRLGGFNIHQDLVEAITRADASQAGWTKERGEDSDAMRSLVAAREGFDRVASAHGLLVRSLLVRQGREAELGRFVKTQDPAYAARRRAQQPIEEEPDADTLTDDLLADDLLADDPDADTLSDDLTP